MERIIDKKIPTPHLSHADGGSLLTGVFRHVSTSYFRRITFGRLGKSENSKILSGKPKKLCRITGKPEKCSETANP